MHTTEIQGYLGGSISTFYEYLNKKFILCLHISLPQKNLDTNWKGGWTDQPFLKTLKFIHAEKATESEKLRGPMNWINHADLVTFKSKY